jgi:hypothetical protein
MQIGIAAAVGGEETIRGKNRICIRMETALGYPFHIKYKDATRLAAASKGNKF